MQNCEVIKAQKLNMYILSTCGLYGLVCSHNTSQENYNLAQVTEFGLNVEFVPSSPYSFYTALLPISTLPRYQHSVPTPHHATVCIRDDRLWVAGFKFRSPVSACVHVVIFPLNGHV